MNGLSDIHLGGEVDINSELSALGWSQTALLDELKDRAGCEEHCEDDEKQDGAWAKDQSEKRTVFAVDGVLLA